MSNDAREAKMPEPVNLVDYWESDQGNRHYQQCYVDSILEMLARERERADRHEGAVRAYIEDADAMRMQRDDALIKLAKVMEGLRETYEIYAGMETTPLPILASEAYLLRIIDQMQKSVTAILRTIEGETPG